MEREQVLAKLRERIVLFAASHLSRDAAEDLAQEVLLLLHEKYAHLERVEDLLPLSLQIVRFKIMSQRRKSVRRGEYTQVSITDIQLPDLDANPAEYVERKQMLDRLAKAMSGLGDRCRELMRLKLQGKAFPEIQKIMGVAAINTIYTWDHRCRKNLLEAMGGSWEPQAMSPEDIKKLLGGYATGTLTEAEQQALFAAALEDQELFDALANEQPLRDLLTDPAARATLLSSLGYPGEPAGRFLAMAAPAPGGRAGDGGCGCDRRGGGVAGHARRGREAGSATDRGGAEEPGAGARSVPRRSARRQPCGQRPENESRSPRYHHRPGWRTRKRSP